MINFRSMQNAMGWLSFIFSILGILYFFYKAMHIIRRSIIVFENKVNVQEDIGSKDIKLQYKVEIEFKQIDKISLVISSNNSLNQYMRFVITPMPYIVLHLVNGKEKMVNVYYYSKKQTVELIDYIIVKKKLVNRDFSNKSGKELMDNLKKH